MQLARKVFQEPLVHKVLLAQLVHKVLRVLLAPPVLLAQPMQLTSLEYWQLPMVEQDLLHRILWT